MKMGAWDTLRVEMWNNQHANGFYWIEKKRNEKVYKV